MLFHCLLLPLLLLLLLLLSVGFLFRPWSFFGDYSDSENKIVVTSSVFSFFLLAWRV